MEPDALRAGDSSSGRNRPAPSRRPSISKSRAATIRRLQAGPPRWGTHARASREIPAYRSARPGCASSASRFALQVDARRFVSSVAPLAVERRLDVPTLFQCSADLLLRQLFLLRPIIRLPFWLTVFRDE